MAIWDILIASIPHRHATLLPLLAELDRQLQPGVGVIMYRDDLEASYGAKTQALVRASSARYVSCADDDDMVAPDFIAKVLRALAHDPVPDYVGFRVKWTRDGVEQVPVYHSLQCGGWRNLPDRLERDIAQFNPIRRELSLLGTWEGGNGAEVRWGSQVRATGQCRSEVFIDEPLYWYQEKLSDTFLTPRQPLGAMPELPSYPWLRQIGPYA